MSAWGLAIADHPTMRLVDHQMGIFFGRNCAVEWIDHSRRFTNDLQLEFAAVPEIGSVGAIVVDAPSLVAPSAVSLLG